MLLLGMGRFRMLGTWWKKMEGATVAGCHRFVTSSLLPLIFSLGIFLLLPQPDFELLY
jgi:hypothetical protein